MFSKGTVEFEGAADALFNDPHKLLLNYDGWVRSLVRALIRRYPFAYEEYEDICQEALITLMECARAYDVSKGVPFKLFAYKRIRYSSLNYIRKCSTSRSLESVISAIKSVKIEGDAPSEITQLYHSVSASTVVFWLKVYFSLPEEQECHDEIVSNRTVQMVRKIIDGAGDIERRILVNYYVEGLSFADIGVTLRLSRSRICQIHGRLIQKIRGKLISF